MRRSDSSLIFSHGSQQGDVVLLEVCLILAHYSIHFRICYIALASSKTNAFYLRSAQSWSASLSSVLLYGRSAVKKRKRKTLKCFVPVRI